MSKVEGLQEGSAVKALAAKPDDLSSSPRTQMEKERISLHKLSSYFHMYPWHSVASHNSTYMYTYM